MNSNIKVARDQDVAENGARTAHPCMRCLNRFAKSGLGDGANYGCIFPVIRPSLHNAGLWSSFKHTLPNGEVKQILRCKACLAQGQDCFAPPDTETTEYRALENACLAIEEENITRYHPASAARPDEPATESQEAKTVAERLHDRKEAHVIATRLFLTVNSTVTPYHVHLSAHNGALGFSSNPRSDVILKGRVRSKEGIIQKEALKRKERESAAKLGGSPHGPSPKKGRFGMVGAYSGDTTFMMSDSPVPIGTGPNAKKDAKEYALKVEQVYFDMDVEGQSAFEKILGVPTSARSHRSPRRRD